MYEEPANALAIIYVRCYPQLHVSVTLCDHPVHPEDGRRRRPKHVGVVNTPYIIASTFVGFHIRMKVQNVAKIMSLNCFIIESSTQVGEVLLWAQK